MTGILKAGAFKAFTHLFKLFPYNKSLNLTKAEPAPSPPCIIDAQDISGSLQNSLSTEQLIELRPRIRPISRTDQWIWHSKCHKSAWQAVPVLA